MNQYLPMYSANNRPSNIIIITLRNHIPILEESGHSGWSVNPITPNTKQKNTHINTCHIRQVEQNMNGCQPVWENVMHTVFSFPICTTINSLKSPLYSSFVMKRISML